MFLLFVWVIIGAFFIGGAKGVIQGKRLEEGGQVTTWAITAALYAGALLYVAPWEEPPPLTAEQIASRQEDRQRSDALAACGRYVRDHLKLPDSLDWQYSKERAGRDPAGNWLVSREFIAENSYGGRVRSTALCLYDGKQLINAKINDI